MKASHVVPYVILAAGLAVAVVRARRGRGPLGRLLMSRRGEGSGPAQKEARPRPAVLAGLFGPVGLVAEREVRARLRGRIFRVGTVLILAAIVLAIVIPATTSTSSRPTERVGTVGALAPSTRGALALVGQRVGATLRVVQEGSRAQAEADLRAGRVGVVVVAGGPLLVEQVPVATDTSTGAKVVRELASVLGTERAFAAANLTPEQARRLAGAKPVAVEGLEQAVNETARNTSLIGLPLLFILFVIYNSWILMGVMEEKASRVVEVLLSTLRPLQLLAGKVLGIGLVALLQAGLIVGAALVAAAAVGSNLLQGSTPLFLGAVFAWLLLGYAFYCWVYAAVGSLAERQDQVQSLTLPLTAPIAFGYIVALSAQATGSASMLVKVLAYLPPTAPFAMPALVGLGAVAWWGFVLSAALSVVCTVAVARVAGAVYRRAILRTGRRVRLAELVRSARSARPARA